MTLATENEPFVLKKAAAARAGRWVFLGFAGQAAARLAEEGALMAYPHEGGGVEYEITPAGRSLLSKEIDNAGR